MIVTAIVLGVEYIYLALCEVQSVCSQLHRNQLDSTGISGKRIKL